MNERPIISAVVAMGRGRLHNRVIGKNNELLWHIPDDLRRFKAITLGHPIIMGRKTYESIKASLGGPLPGRTNIVITRDPDWNDPKVTVVHSVDEGIDTATKLDQKEIFIGGGSQIYEQTLARMDRLYLTLIDDEKEGDSYFPPYEKEFKKRTYREVREWNGIKYEWVDLER